LLQPFGVRLERSDGENVEGRTGSSHCDHCDACAPTE
jgi:hypothetical protein